MASSDVDSLFTNILVNAIPKNDSRNLVNLATKESFFTFNKFFIQVNRVVMGSPLGPILANNSLSQREEN